MGKTESTSSSLALSTQQKETFSETSSEGFDDDSQASYVYHSEEDGMDTSSVCTEDERDYFGDASADRESDQSEIAWEDSDEDSMLREEMDADAAWLTTEGLAKTIRRKTTKISFKLSNRVFSANCRIKLFKVFESFMVAVDTFNVIYLMTDFNNFKAYKIDYFRITDVAYFGGRLLFSGAGSAIIKELSLDGKPKEINKRTGPVVRMIGAESLYVAGDKLFRFDRRMNLKDVFNQKFKDLCVSKTAVVGLKANGDIFVFDKELRLQKKHSFPEKFCFSRIFCTEQNYFLATEKGFYVLNHNFEMVKEFANMKGVATGFGYNADFIFWAGDAKNSLRIIKPGLVSYDKFPFSKVRINPISALDVSGDTLYFAHSKFISTLRFTYV